MRYLLIIAALFCSLPQISAQNNIAYGAGISYTNGAPSFVPPARTSRVAIDTITGKWYHFNTPGGWQLLGNTIEEIAGCSAPAYTPGKGDSKVVINNCTEPELYYWTGSAWVWINEGATYYAGEGIRIQNDSIILDSLYYLQFRTGDTTDLDAGRLSWNAQEGTLDVVINSGNVTGQVFEDVFFNCKNQTGSTITRGTVVMAVGTLGASGRILIAPAIADGSVNSEYILGTAAQDIANGSDGLVYHFGKDRGLNTTGASCGETWADRDVLYCSATTAGCLTKTIPTAPNLKVPVAIVLNAASNGTLFVRPSHFPDLNQINDVQLTSPTTGQTLIYNSVTGVWSNQTQPGLIDNGVAGYLPQYTGITTIDTTGVFWNANAGRLGIGTSSPGSTLDVSGRITQTSLNGSIQLGLNSGLNDDLTSNNNIAIGNNALYSSTTFINNIAIGANAGYSTLSSNNIAIGIDAATAVTSGLGYAALGYRAGYSNTTGSNWFAAGYQAGLNNITGSNWFAAGFQSAFNANGSSFLSIGYRAAFTNTSGTAWGAIGSQAGRNNQTGSNWNAIGFEAGLNATGSSWTVIGTNAASSNISGNGFIAIGHNAARYRLGVGTDPAEYFSSSIYIGNTTRATNGTLAVPTIREIVIGDAQSGLGSNTTAIGSDQTTQTWLGGSLTLGLRTAPAARLHVVGAGSTSSTWTAQFHNASTGGNNALMIRDDGNIGIGTSSPGAKLQINGSGNTSASTALAVTNSDGVNLLRVRNDLNTSINYLRIGNSFTNSTYVFPFTTNEGTADPAGTNLSFYNYTGSSSATGGVFTFSGNTFTQTSGAQIFFRSINNFYPTSGNATFDAFNIKTTVNQTGGANGITRGLYINPFLIIAADWRSIEWSNTTGFGLYGSGTATNYLNGNLGIKTTSPTDLIDINGANGYSQLRLRTAYTPTGTADANGNTGDVSWDANYIYIKTAAGWKRSALSTF
jgi:hypothetical protein